ncbi:MAG: response regulator [Eubacteriales bacterium]|nr:response regulator [Eubacteriales bacterium]
MDAQEEKRIITRVNYSAKGEAEYNGTLFQGEIINFSLNGLLFQSDKLMDVSPQEKVSIIIHWDDTEKYATSTVHCVVAEAFEKYKALSPDLVTLDITMPNVDGITVLKDIMKYDPSARVVMITALGKGETILTALNAGARNYITKPFAEDKIINAIQEALE